MRSSTRRPAARLACLTLAVAATVAGCTHAASGPKPAAFSPGGCRSAAVTVLDVGRLIRPVLGHPSKAYAVANSLTTAQDQLRSTQHVDRTDSARLQPLVTAIGYYRMTIVGHTYTDATGRAVASAQRAVVSACTTGG